jgi:hypothetical protein
VGTAQHARCRENAKQQRIAEGSLTVLPFAAAAPVLHNLQCSMVSTSTRVDPPCTCDLCPEQHRLELTTGPKGLLVSFVGSLPRSSDSRATTLPCQVLKRVIAAWTKVPARNVKLHHWVADVERAHSEQIVGRPLQWLVVPTTVPAGLLHGFE